MDPSNGDIGADCPDIFVPNADLHNCDLGYRDLRVIDLSGAKF